MRRVMRRRVSRLLIFALVLSVCTTWNVAFGQTVPPTGGHYLEKSKINTFDTNFIMCDGDETDRAKVTADGSFLTVDYVNSAEVLEYRVALRRTGYTKVLGYVKPINGGFKETYYVGMVPDGRYYVQVARAKTEKQMDKENLDNYGDGGVNWLTTAEVIDGKIAIEKYHNIMRKNVELREFGPLKDPKFHLDPTLKDMNFVLTDKLDKDCRKLKDNEIEYIRNVAYKITEGCYTDYEKARAIYKYIGENLYYDVFCNKNDPKESYLHPYRNLRAIEEGIKYPNTTYDCKVATLCTGYASMNIALLRSLGIPARMVYGFHLSNTKKMWEDAEGVETRSTHYWTEFYCDGKWMSCDSYMAGGNKWYRDSLEDPGRWATRGFISFSKFNPTEECFAVSHYGQGIFTKTVVGDKHDIQRLGEILCEKDEYGDVNYSKLGLGIEDINVEKGYIYLKNPSIMYSQCKGGRLQKVNWSGRDVYFDGKFKNFDGLNWLILDDNPQLNYLSVTNCDKILSLYARNCSIRNLYAQNCPNIKRIYTDGNPIKFAKYSFISPYSAGSGNEGSVNGNVKSATIRTTRGGTVEIHYREGVHKIKANPNIDYKFKGWYNQNGKRISKYRSITLKKRESFQIKAVFIKK